MHQLYDRESYLLVRGTIEEEEHSEGVS